ncbi:hypothetical protein JCM8097_004580 [Rhodosporidiobolus ruineniae]
MPSHKRRRTDATVQPSALPSKQHFYLLLAGTVGLALLLAALLAFNRPSSSSSSASPSTSPASKKSSSSATATGTNAASAAGPTASVTPTKETAWMPVEKVRGVNLGSLFVFEPLGCAAYSSEWPCIEALGLDALQTKFEAHWGGFYNETDFQEMARVGVNTVRIPLGYWTVDSLIQDGEYFARGSMKYLTQVLGWAKAAGLYVILDLHAAPGVQVPNQSFTGREMNTTGFFSDANYQRAYDCLANWTTMAHTEESWSTVAMIEVVNEPLQDSSTNLTSVYYPGAQKAIRDAEAALGISCDGGGKSCLAIQFMDKHWGSGDPSVSIDTSDHIAYDDHNYAQWIVSETNRTRDGYLSYICTNTRSTNMSPIIVGEWSLSTIGGGELETNSTGAQQFFQDFFAASVVAAEKGAGQVFWSWKTELDSPTWGYWDAIQAGYIPADWSTLNRSNCVKCPSEFDKA